MKIKIVIFITMNLLFSQDDYYLDFEIITNSDHAFPENIFIHSMGDEVNRYMAILDTSLSPIWYINSDELGMDFKVNHNRLSYFDKLDLSWITMDQSMNETDTLVSTENYHADYHDFLILPNEHYVILSYDSINVDMSEFVDGGVPFALINGIGIIEEFNENDSLIFRWDAWEKLDITDYPDIDLTEDEITWMHLNSMEIDIDENIIISDRRNSQILKIDRFTGDIIWIMGGSLNEFTFIDDPFEGFKVQHDARRIENGNLMIFDNRGFWGEASRVVEYLIDEDNKTATMIWEYSHPEEFLALAMGSAQRLDNQNTLINWGLVGPSSIITEVDYNKNIVLEIIYPDGSFTYKVRKSDWMFDINLIIGDSNLDEIVDILDIMYLVNYILLNEHVDNVFHLFKIDINKDHSIDVTDILLMVYIALDW